MRSKTEKVFIGIGVAVSAMVIIAVSGLVTGLLIMWLWNWLMPMLFGLKTINYLEGWGISCLTGLLFRSTVKTETKK